MTAIGLSKSTVVVNFDTKQTERRRHSIPEGLHVWEMMELSKEWHNYTKTWLPTDKTNSLFRRDVSFAKCSLWGFKSISKWSMNLFTLDDETSGTTRPSTRGHIPENLNLLPCSFFLKFNLKITLKSNVQLRLRCLVDNGQIIVGNYT